MDQKRLLVGRALFIFIFILSLFIVTYLSIEVLHNYMFAINSLQYQEYQDKNELISTKGRNFVIVSLTSRDQKLRGEILLEQGIKVAQYLSVPYAKKPQVSVDKKAIYLTFVLNLALSHARTYAVVVWCERCPTLAGPLHPEQPATVRLPDQGVQLLCE